MRHAVALGFADGDLELRVLGGVESSASPSASQLTQAFITAFRRFWQILRAGDEGGNLLLLAHLPGDVFFDIGMIDIDDDHFGGAARGAARLDGAGGAVADLQEAHQARRLAAAGELFIGAAQ